MRNAPYAGATAPGNGARHGGGYGGCSGKSTAAAPHAREGACGLPLGYLSASAPTSLRKLLTAPLAAIAMRPESLAIVQSWKPMPNARAA